MILLRFMWLCLQAYRSNEPKYFAIARYGVPNGVPIVVCMIARGREAWKVTDFASNFYGHIRGVQN